MGIFLKLKSCFCSRKIETHADDDGDELSRTFMSTSGQMKLNSSTNLKIEFLEESVPNQRGLVEESVAALARTDSSYQDMLSMLRFLSMGGGGGGEHLSVNFIEELIKESGEEIQEDDMRDAFAFFDADKNGSISANDLHTTLLKMGENASEEECRLMIQAVSGTNDENSSVMFEDFQHLLVRDN